MNDEIKTVVKDCFERIHTELNYREEQLYRNISMLEEQKYLQDNWYSSGQIPNFQLDYGDIKIEIQPTTLDEVKPYMKRLRQLGYKRIFAHTKETAVPFWKYQREGFKPSVYLRADFSQNTDGDSCHLVEVGTREVPIMELVCPEGEDLNIADE